MIHQGSCHCGRSAFEAETEMETVMECNCSHCARKGYLLHFMPREKLRLTTPEANLSTYTFNKHAIRHRFCEVCGCAPFGEANDPKRGHTVALNVRCIPALDLSTIEVKKVDGRSL